MLNVGVIGIGNCGNQVARLAFKEAQCEVFAINTSEKDLATLEDGIPKRCIGDLQGSGKNREDAKAFLKDSIMEIIRDEEFINFMKTKEVVLVVSSMGGGTGSGAAPIMSSIIREAFKAKDGSDMITILTGVMPKLAEGKSTQENAESYIYELYEKLDAPTYMIFDNNNFAKESATKVLELVNAEIVDAIKVMQCRYNAATPYDSIDEKDMKMLLSSPGRIFITTLLDLKEKDVDERDIEDLLIERIKKSAHTELQRDGIVLRTGLITNLSPKLNERLDTHIRKVIDFVGEPSEEFLHIAVNAEKTLQNNVALILTGLSKITDRVDKLIDRIDEIDRKNAELEESELGITEEAIEKIKERRGRRTVADTSENKADIESIFAKFGV